MEAAAADRAVGFERARAVGGAGRVTRYAAWRLGALQVLFLVFVAAVRLDLCLSVCSVMYFDAFVGGSVGCLYSIYFQWFCFCVVSVVHDAHGFFVVVAVF